MWLLILKAVLMGLGCSLKTLLTPPDLQYRSYERLRRLRRLFQLLKNLLLL